MRNIISSNDAVTTIFEYRLKAAPIKVGGLLHALNGSWSRWNGKKYIPENHVLDEKFKKLL